MTYKQELFTQLAGILEEKINHLKESFDQLQDSLINETKSSAGDKHETSRAAIHLEQENLSKQLGVLLQQQETILRSSINNTGNVSLGSLVKTQEIDFIICGFPHKFSYKNKVIYSLSISSPMGLTLKNAKEGSIISLGGKNLEVLGIE